MNLKIDATNYQRTFGRAPKAHDYALWIFHLSRSAWTDNAWAEFTWSGTYATAAKLAKAEAKQLGCTMIRIAP